jgi:hypothetical protein
VIGSSDKRGEELVDRSTSPADLIESVYNLMGIDTTSFLPHPQGLKVPVMPRRSAGERDGRLFEIMKVSQA